MIGAKGQGRSIITCIINHKWRCRVRYVCCMPALLNAVLRVLLRPHCHRPLCKFLSVLAAMVLNVLGCCSRQGRQDFLTCGQEFLNFNLSYDSIGQDGMRASSRSCICWLVRMTVQEIRVGI